MAYIYEKGIVAIPKHVLELAGLKVGMQVQTFAEPGRVVIEQPVDALEEFMRLRKKANLSGKAAESRLAKIEKQMKRKMLHVP